MSRLEAGQAFPNVDVHKLGGDVMTLGTPNGGHDWQMVVVYRGLHCPLCKKYLAQLDEMAGDFNAVGVDVVTVSGDPKEKAQSMLDEKDLSLPVGWGLTLEQMSTLGLYISDPRSPEETDRPFAEPGTFVINAEGNIAERYKICARQ
jgi:peroxiredoxin